MSFDELLLWYEEHFFESVKSNGSKLLDEDLMALLILEVMKLRRELSSQNIQVQNEIHSGLTRIARTFDPYYTKQTRR
jgi:hypothetical protein